MNRRWLSACTLLIFAFSNSTFAQSLGDVARACRAERQRSGVVHHRVITNDDIPGQSVKTESAGSTKDEQSPEVASGKDKGPSAKADEASSKADVKVASGPAAERELRELELQKRTDEINKQYVDKIADIRLKIEAAQAKLAKIQTDRIESSFEYQRTLGVSPNPSTYDQQQRFFSEQIEVQQNSITSLNLQLEDAKESARHAGVPHATD